MKLCVYTICNNSYLNKLMMMLDSFYLHNANIDFHLLLCDNNATISQNHKNVIIHDMVSVYEKYSQQYQKPSYACKKIKSLFNTCVDIFDYDIVVYTDCDVLFYKDITRLLPDKDFQNIYFSHDGGRERAHRSLISKICTGFFMFAPQNFPNILNDWSVAIDQLIINRPKYVDQPAMKNLMTSNQYINKFAIIPVEQISMKFKRPNAIATHYIRKYGHNMYKDYHTFIKGK